MNIKRLRTTVGILAILTLLYITIDGFILPAIKMFSENNISNENTILKKQLAKTEYLNLFSESAKEKIINRDNSISKSKFSYAAYTWKNKYKIVIHKVNIPAGSIFNNMVKIQKGYADLTPDVIYKGYQETGGVEFSYSTEYDSLITNMYITYSDSLSNITNIGDSIVNYDIVSNNISFRYEEHGAKDMIFTAKQDAFGEKNPKIEMNITLYKKNKSIYIIVVYPYLREELSKTRTILPQLFKIYNHFYNL